MARAYKRNPSAKRPPGRPRVPAEQRADYPLTGYVTKKELDAVIRAVRAAGVTVSSWVGDAIRAKLGRRARQ